jgi:DNA-binding transcriptional regulator GbsR (MarR family)
MHDLNPAAKQFILHWGEMSNRWGINRSAAQIHGLLYLSENPLSAQEIADTLSIARSNVSTSLRELQAWGVVRVVRHLGDRRDYFQAVDDAWELFRVILEQRKRREIDPTLSMLRGCVKVGKDALSQDSHTLRRMRELLELLEKLTSWYGQMISLPLATQRQVLNLGSKLQMISGKKTKTGEPERDPPA